MTILFDSTYLVAWATTLATRFQQCLDHHKLHHGEVNPVQRNSPEVTSPFVLHASCTEEGRQLSLALADCLVSF